MAALPARFAWLPGTVAIILGREPAALARISASAAAAAATVAVTIAVAIEPATASAPAAAARPAASAAARSGFGTRLIHFQRSPANFLAVQARHSLRGFRIVGHLHECESACPSRFPVHGDVNAGDLSERFKKRAQLRFRRLKIHISDKHVLHDFLSFKEWESAERAASMAGFRSLGGDGEDRMKSRKVNIPNTPEGCGNPRLPYKT
jgi:hypothetical protein